LIGAKAAGRKQVDHKYLYWELGNQSAVRMGHWKAVRPRTNAPWELYDLKKDISETHNVATDNPKIFKQMKTIAAEAHEPAVEGTFADRANHEKDRRAKYGSTRPLQRPGRAKWKTKGLIPGINFKVLRFSSENRGNGKLARNAIDGNANTIWHTQFSSEIVKHPHELIIDLGREHTIKGFRYLPRQDAGWNGTIKEIEITVSNNADKFGEPAARVSFKKIKTAQDVKCDSTKGRYIRIRALSEINGGPWASIAEFGVIGK
jgi:hypothetical protein